MEDSSSSHQQDQQQQSPPLESSDDDSRGESSSSGALSPVPTTPQDEQEKPLTVAKRPRDASGTFQAALQQCESAESVFHTDENVSRDDETASTPPTLVEDSQHGSPGNQTVGAWDEVPRGIDPPPSRAPSPSHSDTKAQEVSKEDTPQQHRESNLVQESIKASEPAPGEIETRIDSTSEQDESEPVEESTRSMAPDLPSLFPVEKREGSEDSLDVDQLLDSKQVDGEEQVVAPSLPDTLPHHENDTKPLTPLTQPQRPREAPSDDSGEYNASGTSYLQPHPLLPSSIPAELPQQPPYLASAPYGYPMHPGITAPQPGTSAHPLLPAFASSSSGRRKIKLRLVQEMSESAAGHKRTGSFLFRRSFRTVEALQAEHPQSVSRGSVVVSWFEGTSSLELQEHVRKCVARKVGLSTNVRLYDMRILDETVDPPEEIVLSTFIPGGSEFLLRFRTRELTPQPVDFPRRRSNSTSMAPVSPSAAPSPLPSSDDLAGLNDAQLSLLGAHLQGLHGMTSSVPKTARKGNDRMLQREALDAPHTPDGKSETRPDGDGDSKASTDVPEEEVLAMSPEAQIEARLQQLTDLLVSDRAGKRHYGRQEKKQVIFVLANYFVLFMSLIAISAEIQARAPRWMAWMERNLESVQTCATDQDSLYDCVSNGDFSGLIASFILWFGRSAATKRFFLFGFETPKRLWTVVYEALVTAFCWGISYMFIRRGMNPDTRPNFLQKYWKDAVYGSLAGFNASFLKAILKNLIPQEALEDALQDRQLKILSWLPSFN